MPGEEEYAGMTLAEAIRHLAEVHAAPETRHISQAERDLLLKAAAALERSTAS